MIGGTVTTLKGEPVDGGGKKLSKSNYQPALEVRDAFGRVQKDYQTGYMLQRRPLKEFDGYSYLDRMRLDQETFAAYVGVEYLPVHKKWRWQGKRNTARNKIIGILAHMLAGMLFPYVFAQNDQNEDDKMLARVMKIMVEDALKKAKYETKFLYMVLSALVNPATFVQVEYVNAIQIVKKRLDNGTIKIIEAVDEILSGLNLNVVPGDEILLTDLYAGTGNIQAQPCILRVRRISYDTANAIYGKHEDFKYVQAGQTHWVSGGEDRTLFDVQTDESDGNFVQVLTAIYRSEDLELTWVGGVFMGNKEDIYNTNPVSHRRMVAIEDDWCSIPVYEYAMSGFEPIDPAGRFVYYKAAAFKEYWDYLGENKMDALMMDGTHLDVIKPLFLAGLAKADATVMVPGATIALPTGATVTPYSLGPNLSAAITAMRERQQAMSESTQDKINSGVTQPGITATQTIEARKQAQIFLGVFGLMVADLIRQVGELAMDCIIMNSTVGKLDASLPEGLKMKYDTFLAKGKEHGKDVTHRISFTDKYLGRTYSEDQKKKMNYDLLAKAGGVESDQVIWEVNPYVWARSRYSMVVDADQIISRAMGSDRLQKEFAFERMTDPRVQPYVDMEAIVNDFVIEEYSEGDPERYKAKQSQQDPMLQAIMGNNQGQVGPRPKLPTNPAMI